MTIFLLFCSEKEVVALYRELEGVTRGGAVLT